MTDQPAACATTDVIRQSRIPCEIVDTNEDVIRRFADDIVAEFTAAKSAGRQKVVFILPVGPVGQYDLVAARCNAEGLDLSDLVVISMDEYLDPAGKAFIGRDDPLSFRRHMDDHFYRVLRPELAPPPQQRIFPDPSDLDGVAAAIDRHGGVDVCFAGVGITGHLAFNDPPEPGESVTVEAFAALPTRVVELSRETRLINSVTTSRGNVDRIPRHAVTVGMKEILGSRKVRCYMNRPWQSAVFRKVTQGPVSASTPASLLQRHPDVRLVIASYVALPAEPTLR